MKKQVLGILVTFLSLFVPCQTMAQEIVEVVDSICIDEIVADTINVDEIMSDKAKITQYDLKEYEWVDICYNPKYAIVTLRVDRLASPQLAWLSTDTEWLGYATTEDIYAEEDKEHTTAIGKQVAFAGVFPLANPRYTICIVGDKLSKDATPALFQDVVNPLVSWLLKRI